MATELDTPTAPSLDHLHQTKTLICALNLISRNLPLPPDIFDSVSSIYFSSPAEDNSGAVPAPSRDADPPPDDCQSICQFPWLAPRELSTKTLRLTAKDSMTPSLKEHGQEQKEEEIKQTNAKEVVMELAKYWRSIHGQDDWIGMLDPLDPLLRSELIKYGDMAQACYDAFDYDQYSKYCGSCKYNRRKFFESLGLSSLGYHVTRYLYATSNIKLPNFFKQSVLSTIWSEHANWIGYVAVSDDETTKRIGRRDITIAWRGTVTKLEWIADMMDYLTPISSDGIPCPDPTVRVESGFVNLYTDKDEKCRFCKYSAREQILTEVKRLTEQYSDEELSITITGHSLGSALAMLSAFDIAEVGLNVSTDGSTTIPVCVFSFSGPRVGNSRFKERIEALGVKVLRVVNMHDSVPKVPGLFFNENVPKFVQRIVEGFPWSYSHVGVELVLNHRHSPFLKDTTDLVSSHNLEAHLHLLDGYHGKGQRFMLASGRDPALVNKASDFLKEHHLVPPFWRQDENKGMIRNIEGRWVQPERPKIEDHPTDMHDHLHKIGLTTQQ